MPEVAAVGLDLVSTGHIQSGCDTVFIDGNEIAVVGSMIETHGSHSGATIEFGSSTVFAAGKAVARVGDLATCGDTVATGRSNIFAG